MAIMRSLRCSQACVIPAAVSVLLLVYAGASASAQSSPAEKVRAISVLKSSGGGESGATRAYEGAVRQGHPALHAFLAAFPKGADLHVHLSGAVYAETFIHDAGEDGLCVDPVALKFIKATCTEPLIPASRLSGVLAPADQDLYDRLIDSFSMRSFV